MHDVVGDVTISNIEFTEDGNLPDFSLDLQRNSGRVTIENCTMSPFGGWPTNYVYVADCPDVVFNHCDVLGYGSPVHFLRSNVRATDTVIAATYAPAHALRLEQSTLTLVHSAVVGAPETWPVPNVMFPGSQAAELINSTIVCGPSMSFYAGIGPSTWNAVFGQGTVIKHPTTAYNHASWIDPNVVVSMGNHSGVLVHPAYRSLPCQARTLGTPGAFALSCIGEPLRPPVSLPEGTLFLDPNQFVLYDAGPIASNGERAVNFTVPSIAPLNHTFCVQAVILHNGTIRLSLPSFVTPIWEPGRSWP